jgi:hypothetical protein
LSLLSRRRGRSSLVFISAKPRENAFSSRFPRRLFSASRLFPSPRTSPYTPPLVVTMRMSSRACFGAADRGKANVEPASASAHASQTWVHDTARFADACKTPSFRVLTWNLQLLPGVFAGQGGCAVSLESRARRVVANVLALANATRVDVVAFQEVWHEGSARVIQSGLATVFPNQHKPAAYCGLLTVARPGLKIAHSTFTPFRNTTGVEGWWFTKGVAALALREEDEEKDGLILLNSHLQSDFWNGGAEVRGLQISEIVDALANITDFVTFASQPSRKVIMTKILVGDLNVPSGSVEYENMIPKLVSLTGAVDILHSQTNCDTFPLGQYAPVPCEQCFGGCCLPVGKYKHKTPSARLDYVIDVSNGEEQATHERGATVRGVDGTPRNPNASAGRVVTGLGKDQHTGLPLSDHAPIFALVGLG